MKRLTGILFLTLALFQVPFSAMAVATLGSVTLTQVKCRIFSPNGDSHNDKARFEFDNPDQLPLGGSIYDISGSRVADLKPPTDPIQHCGDNGVVACSTDDVLLWDGKDGDGQVVAGGIYIYDIDFQGKHATGTVVVAR